eukprot:NODE_10583_length_282_cov_54.141631_g8814_i0.p3 GENE.NODE_10583_length_282_cov_54.141631_g8814_i0~~NODE_10583_length_282_cov_54.141631_g8814_i0.p3  ORF type:complete len:66 (+),score=24.62 NODE_10583_length_282_cov_54.141631_g8814_i0:24-200(+)
MGVSCGDCDVKVWNARFELIATLSHDARVYSLGVFQTKYLATGAAPRPTGKVIVWTVD